MEKPAYLSMHKVLAGYHNNEEGISQHLKIKNYIYIYIGWSKLIDINLQPAKLITSSLQPAKF
jgi:hypothetical protein